MADVREEGCLGSVEFGELERTREERAGSATKRRDGKRAEGTAHVFRSLDLSLKTEHSGKTTADLKAEEAEPTLRQRKKQGGQCRTGEGRDERRRERTW